MKKKKHHNSKKVNHFIIILIIIGIIISFLQVLPLIQTLTTTQQKTDSSLNKMHLISRAAATDSSFQWEDTFNNAQNIDIAHSFDYMVEDGMVTMKGTYTNWDDASWTKMKLITIESQETRTNAILKLIIPYDSDMKEDYSDIRFKNQGDTLYLPYWIEEKNPDPNNPAAHVWIKLSQLETGTNQINLFYGNPTASDESDYWTVFDENSWQNTYAHDQQITYHLAKEGAWAPDVCYGEDRYLVTWMEGIPKYLPLGMIYQIQIRGCFYDATGQPMGNRFDITPWTEESSFRCEDPAVAYGSTGGYTNFFIAYESYADPNDKSTTEIKGAIVPRSATHISDVNRFTICDAAGVQDDPRVAFDVDNDRFFVVWEDGRSGVGNYNLYGRLFDIHGTPIGSEKIISTRPHTQCEPWITYDRINHHYLIVWEEGIHASNGPFDIWGQLFDSNGNGLGLAQRISPAATEQIDYNYPSTVFSETSQRFMVIWQEDDISAGDNRGPIQGIMLDEQANKIGTSFPIAQGGFQRAEIDPYLSSSFFVSYDGSGEIWGNLISSEGEVLSGPVQLTDSESSPADWVAMGTDGEQLLITWEDTRIEYVDPYESMDFPDIYTNLWSYSAASSSEITTELGDEQTIILDATITSIEINPENIQEWDRFSAEKTGDISFDILDGETYNVLKNDVSSGVSLSDITASTLRLRARFHRIQPSSSPALDTWSVSYFGEDELPPRTIIQEIQGTEGLNGWYTSESVIIRFHAEDYPVDTGSGVDTIYYQLNEEPAQEYNQQDGLVLSSTQASNWMGTWDVTFWAVDRAGNHEPHQNQDHQITIQIDADPPYIDIITPVDEQQVKVPFWVRASPSDNVGVDRVEFDIEPFGERQGMPYVDTEAPYEWYCNVEEEPSGNNVQSVIAQGTNVMVRAKVFDESGQSWSQEVWVYVTNWNKGKDFQNNLCFVYATGSGSVQTNGIILGELTIGSVDWDFTEGSTVVSAGLSGIQSKTGSQQGRASLFIGYTSNSVIAGIAASVRVNDP